MSGQADILVAAAVDDVETPRNLPTQHPETNGLAMSILVFEDAAVSRLFPITIGRPAYAVTCGGFRLIDGLRELGEAIHGIVRPHLAELQRIDFADVAEALPNGDKPLLLVNARAVPSVANFSTLRAILAEGRPGLVKQGDDIAAALLPPESPRPASDLSTDRLASFFSYAAIHGLDPLEHRLPLFDYPHDVIRHHLTIFADSLRHRLARGDLRQAEDGVFLAEGASLGRHTVVDTRGGPIVLEQNATVGPHCFLSGPAWLGATCKVKEHSAVKDAVSLGHTTKIGGEIEASIVEPFTNKQHYGFLGHSYLGSWINLGAGTCNSDLKNTYGTVNMDYAGNRVATGMQFLGCIMGDYAKTAINTGIFTGKTVGACSMVYGFVTTNVPSFVNYARLFGQVTEMPPDVMIATQKRMFARRNVPQRPCDIQLLQDMYELTRHERQLAGEPLSL